MTLQATLDALRADFKAGQPPYNAPAHIHPIMERATAELIASGAAQRALKLGDKAPLFSLKDADGNAVSSARLLAQGPLVLTFYRGVWCPYCTMELQALQALSRSRRRLREQLRVGLGVHERVLVDEGPGLGVHPLDELLELGRLHPPLAAAADLDRGQVASSHQGIDLGARGVQDLGDVGEREEAWRAGHGSHGRIPGRRPVSRLARLWMAGFRQARRG